MKLVFFRYSVVSVLSFGLLVAGVSAYNAIAQEATAGPDNCVGSLATYDAEAGSVRLTAYGVTGTNSMSFGVFEPGRVEAAQWFKGRAFDQAKTTFLATTQHFDESAGNNGGTNTFLTEDGTYYVNVWLWNSNNTSNNGLCSQIQFTKSGTTVTSEVRTGDDPLPSVDGEFVVTNANLNVRTDPSINSYIIDTVPSGTRGQIFGEPIFADSLEWRYVKFENLVQGWVAIQFTSKTTRQSRYPAQCGPPAEITPGEKGCSAYGAGTYRCGGRTLLRIRPTPCRLLGPYFVTAGKPFNLRFGPETGNVSAMNWPDSATPLQCGDVIPLNCDDKACKFNMTLNQPGNHTLEFIPSARATESDITFIGPTCKITINAVVKDDVELPPARSSGTSLDNPTNLATSAACVEGSGQVTVSWSPVPGATSYIVHRRPVIFGVVYTDQITTSDTSYTDVTALVEGQEYRYKVSACNADGCSDPTSQPFSSVTPPCSSSIQTCNPTAELYDEAHGGCWRGVIMGPQCLIVYPGTVASDWVPPSECEGRTITELPQSAETGCRGGFFCAQSGHLTEVKCDCGTLSPSDGWVDQSSVEGSEGCYHRLTGTFCTPGTTLNSTEGVNDDSAATASVLSSLRSALGDLQSILGSGDDNN